MSLRWSSHVAPKPPKWGSKTQNGEFSSKIALRAWRSLLQRFLCENWQRQSCKAFISLTIPSITLNDLERRNSPYFCIFQWILYIFRPIISQWLKVDYIIYVKYCLWLPLFYFCQNCNTPCSAVSAIAEHLVVMYWPEIKDWQSYSHG